MKADPGASGHASAALAWPALAKFVAFEERLAQRADSPFQTFCYEFVRFGVKQAWACFFGGTMLALLLLTHYFYPAHAALPRYDFLVLASVVLQVSMLKLGLETKEEAKIIFVFHIVGTVMEIFKTAKGSWIYPEPSFLRIGGVPLFTGFMYAAVGSYIARVWRLFDFRFNAHPSLRSLALLATAIYINFFTHHYIWDFRIALFLASAYLFRNCWIHFRIAKEHRRMPMLLGLSLVAVFIWIAENIGTFTSAWLYPSQAKTWSMVSFSKFGSWYLLMLISYTLVYAINGGTAAGTRKARLAA